MTLANRILEYYRKRKGVWISGGEIERIVAQKTTYKASNASRRLRELREDGFLESKEVKGTVYYKYIPQRREVHKVKIENGMAREYVVTEYV